MYAHLTIDELDHERAVLRRKINEVPTDGNLLVLFVNWLLLLHYERRLKEIWAEVTRRGRLP
jgi:hypothetical protein